MKGCLTSLHTGARDRLAGSKDLLERLLSALKQMEVIAACESVQSITCRLSDLRKKIEENRFHLVVVGQFKRGKTSVLNALLGDDVLPVSAVPLTSIVTVLIHGDNPSAAVVFKSGQRLKTSLAELPQYITESGNPENVKAVDHVEVFYPNEYLRDGATLIDTPGIGSTYEHNTWATYAFLPRIDAAIFVTSPEPPLTSTEAAFLTKLATTVSRLFVVMNKADLLDASQLSAVVEFTIQALPKSVLKPGGSIFVVSAKQALSSHPTADRSTSGDAGFRQFETELRQFLKTEKSRVFRDAVRNSVVNVVTDLRMHLRIRTEAAKLPVHELQLRISELNEHLRIALQRHEDNELLLSGSIAQLCSVAEGEARRFAESKADFLESAIKSHFNECEHMSRAELTAELDRFMAWQIQHIFDQWRPDFESSLTGAFRDVTVKFQKSVNELAGIVRSTAATIFGIKVKTLDPVYQLAALEPGGYRTDTLLDWGIGQLPSLLPGILFRRYLLRKMLRMAPIELDRNAGRMIYDLKRRIERSTQEFRTHMRERLDEIIEAIQSATREALARQETDAAQSTQRMVQLEAGIRELDQIADTLKAGMEADYAVEA